MTVTWSYASTGGDAYPVKPGQVWQVGRHIYACLDFMSAEGHARTLELLGWFPPTLLYADPPWGQALVNGYRTKAGLTRATYRWEDLYRRIVGYADLYSVPVWLESGRRERETIMQSILENRAHRAAYPVTYYKRHPSVVYYASATTPSPVDVTGMDDADTPTVVLVHTGPLPPHPASRVFDPCGGRGGTALAAESCGWASLSTELSPHRMSAGLSALSLATTPAHAPRRIS